MRIVIIVGSGLLVALGGVAFKYFADLKAWQQVEQSITRLSSGVKFEPIITLRSKMADSDAAIKTYESGHHLFPLGHKERLEGVKKGIRYLDIAVAGAKEIDGWKDMATNYAEVTRFVPRVCSKGTLVFDKDLARLGFGLGGSYLIREFVQEVSDDERKHWREGLYPPIDLARETADCQKQHADALRKAADAEKAVAAAHQAKWKYHIDVENKHNCLVGAIADGQRVISQVIRARLHLDANREAFLLEVWCDGDRDPADAIKVRINGSEHELHWLRAVTDASYFAQLVPVEKGK